jgi:hypothetical protein
VVHRTLLEVQAFDRSSVGALAALKILEKKEKRYIFTAKLMNKLGQITDVHFQCKNRDEHDMWIEVG